MIVENKLLTPNEYSRPQTPLKKITKIAVHYVGNPKSSAAANRNYFESLKHGIQDRNGNTIYASSHYIVGLQGEIIQCIPEGETAYATYSANDYSISIENCHQDDTGKFNENTRKSLIELCADICERYRLNPLTDIIRHYDIPKNNGYRKSCPLYWVNNPSDFEKFKTEVKNCLNDKGYSIALDKLVKAKIISEPNKWDIDKLDIKNVKYLMKSYLMNTMTQEDMAKTLFMMGVIKSPKAWKRDDDIEKKYIQTLILNMANSIKDL